MAVTKIWTIKDSLQRGLDYAANPDKTEYDALAQTLHYAENDALHIIPHGGATNPKERKKNDPCFDEAAVKRPITAFKGKSLKCETYFKLVLATGLCRVNLAECSLSTIYSAMARIPEGKTRNARMRDTTPTNRLPVDEQSKGSAVLAQCILVYTRRTPRRTGM